jgi:hypothetical protein
MNFDIDKQIRDLKISEEEQKLSSKIAIRQKRLMMNLASQPSSPSLQKNETKNKHHQHRVTFKLDSESSL